MTTADEIRALAGAQVSIRLSPAAGGDVVDGRLVGTLEADDGLAVVIEPAGAPGRRLTYHYQHIASIQQRP